MSLEDHEDLARATVDELLGMPAQFDDFSFLERAEVVWLGDAPGVSIEWTQTTSDQGVRKFGLMATVSELSSGLFGTDTPTDFDNWMFDLTVLTIREPHGTGAPADVRTWLRMEP